MFPILVSQGGTPVVSSLFLVVPFWVPWMALVDRIVVEYERKYARYANHRPVCRALAVKMLTFRYIPFCKGVSEGPSKCGFIFGTPDFGQILLSLRLLHLVIIFGHFAIYNSLFQK